jgi:hypothetical protein
MAATEIETATEAFSGRRVVILAGVLVIVGAVVELIVRHSIESALSLTGAGVVAIINFRWLEALVGRVIQPGKPQVDSGSVLRFLARLALLGLVMAALVLVPRVDGVAIVLGFSSVVVALIVEGVRWARVEGGG